jgi:sulfur-oxidizing protein SoxX
MRYFILLLLPFAAMAQTPPVEKIVAETFADAPEAWKSRVVQDETQRLCSLRHNEPTKGEAEAIEAREKASIAIPPDVMGAWKRGEEIAQNGRGGQFSDPPGTVSGGNCYACHQMAPTELSYGTLGPSLMNYGKVKDFSPAAARDAYAKVFNPQSVAACSTMPRFGRNGVLTEQQIKDVVAYLFDPASPVNAPPR